MPVLHWTNVGGRVIEDTTPKVSLLWWLRFHLAPFSPSPLNSASPATTLAVGCHRPVTPFPRASAPGAARPYHGSLPETRLIWALSFRPPSRLWNTGLRKGKQKSQQRSTWERPLARFVAVSTQTTERPRHARPVFSPRSRSISGATRNCLS